jgi:hypothetical protein
MFSSTLKRMEESPSIRTDAIETGHFFMLTELDHTIMLLDRYGG